MSRELFLREVTVSCGGKEIESPPFDIHFQIRFDDDEEPSDATVDIFNLSDDTVNRMKRGEDLILKAGYKDDVGTIFLGHVDEVESFWDGVDRILRLHVGDATDRWMETHVQKSFAPRMRAGSVMHELLGEFGIEIGASGYGELDNIEYKNGRTFDTRLKTPCERSPKIWAGGCISPRAPSMLSLKITATTSLLSWGPTPAWLTARRR